MKRKHIILSICMAMTLLLTACSNKSSSIDTDILGNIEMGTAGDFESEINTSPSTDTEDCGIDVSFDLPQRITKLDFRLTEAFMRDSVRREFESMYTLEGNEYVLNSDLDEAALSKFKLFAYSSLKTAATYSNMESEVALLELDNLLGDDSHYYKEDMSSKERVQIFSDLEAAYGCKIPRRTTTSYITEDIDTDDVMESNITIVDIRELLSILDAKGLISLFDCVDDTAAVVSSAGFSDFNELFNLEIQDYITLLNENVSK